MKGFTLIELLIVFSVSAILAVLGIASFVSYNQSQTLNGAASELATVLNTARSRAMSQVKPSCTGALDGYKVGFCKANSVNPPCLDTNYDYALYAVCNSTLVSPAIVSKNLPSNISFAAGIPSSFYFRVVSGGIDGTGGTIRIIGSGHQKCITVSDTGIIQIPASCP